MSRYNPPDQTDPVNEKLMRLGALRQLNTPQDDTTNLVKMLTDLYGISAQQQLTPAQVALSKAHTDYYNTQTNEFAHTANSRALQDQAEALYKLFGNVPPDYVDQLAGRMGFHHAPKELPPGEFGANGQPPPKKKPVETQAPWYATQARSPYDFH